MEETEKYIPSLLLQLQSRLGSLTPAERRVADVVLHQPEEVLQMSVSDLAAASRTSDATVVRSIRKFGMSGYHELKVLLAQSMVAPVKMLNAEIEGGDSTADVIQKVFRSVANTLAMTGDISQSRELEEAADALYGARHIYLIGYGNSASAVSDLHQKLLRLGLPVTAQFDPHLLLINIVNYAGPGDVCFAVSHSGHSKLVVDAARMFRERGARVITLSDIADSPLKAVADIALCTMSRETRYNLYAADSKIAQYTLIDVLYTVMSYKHSQDAFGRFASVEALMREYKV